MRTIDTSGLKSIGPRENGPWLLEDDTLLRATLRGELMRTEAEAKLQFDSYLAGRAANLDTPRPLEIVRVPTGYGVVVEYVRGIGLGMHIMLGSYTPEEAGHEMGKLLRSIHDAHSSLGVNWYKKYGQYASAVAMLLPDELGVLLESLVKSIPASNTLLHGDFHVGNVIVSDGCLSLIDMESSGFGHPVFDLAVARSRMLFNAIREAQRMGLAEDQAKEASRALWNAMLAGYFDGVGQEELASIDQRLAVLAEMEICCVAYRMTVSKPDNLHNWQRNRLLRYAQQLEELLPQISQLYF